MARKNPANVMAAVSGGNRKTTAQVRRLAKGQGPGADRAKGILDATGVGAGKS